MERRRPVTIGAGVLILGVLLSGESTATWFESAKIDGARISSGNLEMKMIGDPQWSAKALDGTYYPVTISDYRIVPGGELIGEQPVDLALQGDNMRAKVSVVSQNSASGELLSDSQGVKITYAVFDEEGRTLIPETPVNMNSEKSHGFTPEDTGEFFDGTPDLRVQLRAVFDESTPDRVRTQATAEIKDFKVKIEQTRDAD